MVANETKHIRVADEREGFDAVLPKLEAQPHVKVEGDLPRGYADPHDEPVGIQLRETGADEMYLSVAPVSSAAQLFLFCHRIQRIGAADIAYFFSSPNGTAIKLALRSQVPILDILDEMDEVEEVWEDPALNVGATWGLPTFCRLRIQHSARITLKEC